MKKILLFAIGVLTSVTMLAEVKPYTDSETGFMYEYDTEKKTATFAGVLEANINVKYAVVQSSIKGSDGLDYPVTAIGKEAFKGCSSLRLLTLPETLTSIASNAFSGCDDLKHIYCKVLNPTNILNPGGLPSYSDAKMVTLYVETNESKSNYENDPNWNTKYSRILVGPMSSEPFKYKDGNDDLTGMFYVCAEGSKEATLSTGKNEKDIVVPKTIIYNGDNYNVTGIDRLAFNQFSEIEKLWLPETLTDISNYAFNGCSNLIYIGLEQTASPRYKPSVFPKNELMTLFIPEYPDYSVDGYLNSQWDNSQFDDRIYNGKMIEVPYQGMKYLCADREYDGDAILVAGKDGISYLESSIDINGKYYSLRGIGKSAFKDCTLITSLNVPYGVTTISNMAFQGCSNLQSLTLPSSLKTIGSSAFSGCGKWQNIKLPSSLTTIGTSAFNGCSSLKDLILPSGLTTIGSNAFSNCSNLRTLDIYNLKSIGSGAFNSCNSLAHVRCRIYNPSNLDPTNLPNNEMMTLYVNQGRSKAFEDETNLITTWKAKFNGRIYEGDWKDNVEIDGMYYICSPVSEKATLYKGKSETDITISDIKDGNNTYTVTGIDRQAFKGSSLVNLTLPNTITHIGPEAFSGCNSLDRVVSYIETPFKINENVFGTAKKLYVPEDTRDNYIKFAGWNKFTYKMEGEPISVPNEAGTFICASKSKEAILTIGNKQTTSVTINPSIQDEESNTYQVIAIEKGAFQNSGELVKLTFMDNTGSENSISIGDNAFSSCSKLRVLTLPSKVELGSRVFNGSNNLEYIICKSTSPKIIDNEVFTTTIGTLYVPTSYSGAYNIEGWNKFTKRVECEDMQVHSLDDGMTYEYLSKKVDENTLRTATVIKDSKGSTTVSPKDGILEIKNSVSLPSGGDPYTIVSIAKEAFKGNGNIKELKLSDDITSIGGSAFQNCSNLQNIKLSSTLTTIEDNAFQNCTKLKSFTIPQTLTTIGDNAFEGCLALTELVSDGIEQIGTSAFKDCSGLINVTIPESLFSIGDYAFNGCTNLTEIINDRDEPAIISSNVFSNGKKTRLYVPVSHEGAYEAADGWKDLTILRGLKDEFSDEFNTYSFATGEEFATLTKSLIEKSNYIIPDIVKNPKSGIEYKVTAIDRTAFENNSTLEKLYIPEGIKTIGAKAFYNCSKLKKVELPSSLDFIGDQAFDKCTAINKISSRILSTKLENLCSKITNVFASGISPKVYIPIEDESKYETYWSIFKDKFIEGRLDMGNDVAYGWEYEYFTGKTEEERIATLTQALAESTETSATGYLPILGKVKFASDEEALEYTVTEIAENAFNEYPTPSRVEKLSIEENITSIGDNAFKVLSSLKMVWLPSTLETIGTNAFNTTSITHVCSEATKLPESKSEIVNDSKSPYLFVPQEKTATYLNKNGWKNFAETNIYEGYFVDEKTPETDKYKNLTFLYIKDKKGGETKTAILTKSKTNTNDVEIPSSVSIDTDSYDVIEIAGAAFNTSANLKNITIPESVVKIGDKAFSTCSNLKNITCLNPVPVSISNNVFSSYTAALYVPGGETGSYGSADIWKDFTTIHNGARMVGENKEMGLKYEYASEEETATLIEGKSVANVIIDQNVPNINEEKKVETIAESAFENNTSLQSVVIPDGIVTIEPKAFQNCGNLTTIEFPVSLMLIGKDAFKGCGKINTITSYIPCANLDNLCDVSEVFISDPPISPTIYIPVEDDGLEKYSNKWNISSGTKFIEGYPATNVDENGWEYAYRKGVDNSAKLTKATNSVTDIYGHLKVPGVLKIGTDEIKVTEIAASAFNSYADKSKVNKLTIPENLKKIGSNAFSAFSNVQKLMLPSTLETVEANAFNVNNIKYVCSEATKAPTLAESIFAENKEAYLLVPNVENYKSDTKWSGDKIKIYKGYFVDDITPTTDDYKNQTFICLLNKKDGDEKRAILIKSTTNTEDVEIPESVPLGGEPYSVAEISESAFRGSSNLKNITIPSTVNKIGDNVFANCTQILNIDCKVISPIEISSNVFPGSTASLYVPASDDTNSEEAPVNKYGKADVWKNFSVIHNGNRIIKKEYDLTYEYASGEQYATLIKGETAGDVTIENNVPGTVDKEVTSIGESAFIGNKKITSLTISKGITKIGASAFENCSEISKITLPSGLTDIGEKAFAGCTKIDEIITDVDKDELIKIPDNVFSRNELQDKTIVYVPAESEKAYREYDTSGGWSIFNKFREGKWMGPLIVNNIVYRYHTVNNKATVVGINNPVNENKLEIKYNVTLNNLPCEVDSVVIAKDGFSHPEVVENLIIGEGIKVIGDNAFKECKNLAQVELPSSLTSIGADAFNGCTKLTKLWLPSNLKAIGNNAFRDCKLTHISYDGDELPTINKNVFSNYSAYLFISKGTDYNKEVWSDFARFYEGKFIGESTYDGNKYLYLKQKDGSRTAVLLSNTGGQIPNDPISFVDPKTSEPNDYTVTIIGKEAFLGKDLTNLERLPESIEMIEENAFKNSRLSKLKSLPSNLKKIGKYAFSGNNLVTLEFPSSLTIIEDGAFKDNRMLESMTMKEGLETIGADAFNGCTSLEKLELPKSLMSIGDYAFSKNSKLESLTIQEGLNTIAIGAYAFNECTSLKVLKLPKNLRSIGNYAFNANTNLKNLTLSEGIETIGAYSFKGCSSLKMIELPSSLTSIGTGAFDDCNSLTEVISNLTAVIASRNPLSLPYTTLYVPEGTNDEYSEWKCAHILKGDRKLWNDEDGFYYAYSKGDKKAILIEATKTGDITIPGSITFEEDGEDVACNVIGIDKSVFSGKSDIKKVIIEENVETIGAYAFDGCSNLKQITLPSTLTDIGEHAFDGCINLTEVVSNIDKDDLTERNKLSIPDVKFNLYVPAGSSQKYADAGWGSANIYEGERVEKEIDGLYYAYAENADATNKEAILVKVDAEKLNKDVTIPGSIKIKIKVGDDEKEFDYNVIAIDNSVFYGNTDVKTVKIENGLKYIGVSVFEGCTALERLELPSTLEKIGDKAFDGCDNLTAVVSNIMASEVINSITFSKPNAILYVPEGTLDDYSKEGSGWVFAHIYVGERLEEEQNGLLFVCATGDKTAIVIKEIAEKPSENITIPGSITIGEGESAVKYTVVAIKDDAFSGNTELKVVKIGEGVKTIGANAFQGCTNLQKVWLPSALTKIDENAFDGCNSIAYICTSSKIPLESPNFSKNVFSSYNATLYVPDEEAVGNYKKNDIWKSFTCKVGYFEGVKTQDNIIYECVMSGDVAIATLVKSETTVADVVIPSFVKLDNDTREYKVTTISKVFKGNSNIVTLKIGENIKTIDDEAFLNCSKLQKVWLPSSLESIGNKAFNGCKSITRVSTKTKTMPSLGSDVFSTSSAYLFIPEGTESSWSGFAKVVEGHYVGDVSSDNISYICMETGDATEKTSMLIKAPKTASTFASSVVFEENSYPLTTIGESAFEDNTAIVNLVIPDGVKTIETNAFKKASKLRTVEFPISMESIADNAFQGCNLAYIQSYIETPSAISDNVFADAVYSNAILFVPDNTSNNYNVDGWKKFTIVEGIYSEETIEDMTYLCVMSQDKLVAKLTKSLSKTKEVKVPAKIFIGGINYQVEGIEKSAFEGNSSLEKLIVAEGIKTIGVGAFKQCSKLKSVVLPASLETIGDNAFESCSCLETVTCAGETPVDISKNVFSVTTLEVNVPTRSSVSAYKEHSVWGGYEILYSMSSTSGSDGTENVDVATYQLVTPEGNDVTTTSVAIVDDDNVKGDFVIPTTVTRNGMPYTVTTIAPSAFEGNIELISVSLPPTVTSIGTGAFAGCENLQSMTVNNTVPPTLISTFTGAGARRMLTRGADDSPIFKGVDVENCILYVPEESVEKYKASELWGVFKNIRAISATGMSGVIVPERTPFDVYNLQGRKVKSGVTTLKGLSPGVYIVRGKKVAIK